MRACRVPAALAAAAHERGAVGHHRLVGLAGAIPFDHGEFRRVQRRRARGCGRRGRNRRSSPRRRRAASSWRIRARCGGSAARASRPAPIQLGGEGVEMGLVAGRDLERGGLDLDEAVRRRTSARSAATMRFRASRNGRRSRWRSRVPEWRDAMRPPFTLLPNGAATHWRRAAKSLMCAPN